MSEKTVRWMSVVLMAALACLMTISCGPPISKETSAPAKASTASRPPAPAAGASACAPPKHDEYLVDVHYGTDRKRSGASDPAAFYGATWNRQTEPLDTIEWGVAQVSIPRNRQIGEWSKPSWWQLWESEDRGEDIVLLSVNPTNRSAFATSLRQLVARSESRDAFVFVHGYNVSFKEAAERTAMLAHDIGFPGVPLLYSWPSRATEGAYSADEETIGLAYADLRAFLLFVKRTGQFEHFHLIAHSMGNRLLKDAMAEMARSPNLSATEPFFDDIVLAAADVYLDVFERDYVPVLSKVARHVTLYTCDKDVALKLSEKYHGDHVRVGQQLCQFQGCTSIDASQVMRGWWAMHHSYVTECYEVLRDLHAELIDRTEVSDSTKRPWIARSRAVAACWSLVPQPLPAIGSLPYR